MAIAQARIEKVLAKRVSHAMTEQTIAGVYLKLHAPGGVVAKQRPSRDQRAVTTIQVACETHRGNAQAIAWDDDRPAPAACRITSPPMPRYVPFAARPDAPSPSALEPM
ncbi:hypothetical protein [Limobrevibacterium gyesilva]|uniref:Uncharacterized protein n=1 Tax=Limobrevibacterium gyesilva TaxID=2991712 RepID=A0AA41YQQ7_9PROT|nr:hypothetical protein [Limobrevibacterium gyesilva]MCW3476548.1 hypothetical protein [Limobrevibacterium gyesilva]